MKRYSLTSSFFCGASLSCSPHGHVETPPQADASAPRVAVSITPDWPELDKQRPDLEFVISHESMKVEGTVDGRVFLRLGDDVTVQLPVFEPSPDLHSDIMRRAFSDAYIAGGMSAIPNALKRLLAANDPAKRQKAQEAARQLILDQPALFVGRTREGEYISCALMLSSQHVVMLGQKR